MSFLPIPKDLVKETKVFLKARKEEIKAAANEVTDGINKAANEAEDEVKKKALEEAKKKINEGAQGLQEKVNRTIRDLESQLASLAKQAERKLFADVKRLLAKQARALLEKVVKRDEVVFSARAKLHWSEDALEELIGKGVEERMDELSGAVEKALGKGGEALKGVFEALVAKLRELLGPEVQELEQKIKAIREKLDGLRTSLKEKLKDLEVEGELRVELAVAKAGGGYTLEFTGNTLFTAIGNRNARGALGAEVKIALRRVQPERAAEQIIALAISLCSEPSIREKLADVANMKSLDVPQATVCVELAAGGSLTAEIAGACGLSASRSYRVILDWGAPDDKGVTLEQCDEASESGWDLGFSSKSERSTRLRPSFRDFLSDPGARIQQIKSNLATHGAERNTTSVSIAGYKAQLTSESKAGELNLDAKMTRNQGPAARGQTEDRTLVEAKTGDLAPGPLDAKGEVKVTASHESRMTRDEAIRNVNAISPGIGSADAARKLLKENPEILEHTSAKMKAHLVKCFKEDGGDDRTQEDLDALFLILRNTTHSEHVVIVNEIGEDWIRETLGTLPQPKKRS